MILGDTPIVVQRWPSGPGVVVIVPMEPSLELIERLRVPIEGADQSHVADDDDLARVQQVGQARVVIAPDLRVHPELAQVLDQVEHEAVVIVDDQDLHRARLPGTMPRPAGQ